ncbi:MAG: hypothetical protein EXR71_13595 [Myxococcales bacterium]|nr:hypothetical protein [Myxococcales bacterium]
MTAVTLLLLPTLSEGPLARVELSWSRPDAEQDTTLVAGAAARLRGDARVSETGLRVDAGCARERCTVAVDGLAGAVDAALPALGDALLGDAPRLSPATRRGLRRSWSRAWRSTGRLLTAGLRRAAEGWLAPGAGPRPRLTPVAIAGDWDTLRGSIRHGELAAAGAYDEPAVRALAARIDAQPVPRPSPVGASPPPGSFPETPGVVIVDWPGATRAQLGIAWLTNDGDSLRDALLAGDFESRLMQRLRETDALTYGVEPTWGRGWAGAVFDVATESAPAAIAAAREELAHVHEADPAAVEAAARRRGGRALALGDTLAGRLALTRLELGPSPASGSLSPAARHVVVVVGDADVITPALGPGAEVISRRELMY